MIVTIDDFKTLVNDLADEVSREPTSKAHSTCFRCMSLGYRLYYLLNVYAVSVVPGDLNGYSEEANAKIADVMASVHGRAIALMRYETRLEFRAFILGLLNGVSQKSLEDLERTLGGPEAAEQMKATIEAAKQTN